MTTVYFSFSDPENARRFVAAALDHGATKEDVSVLAQDANAWTVDQTGEWNGQHSAKMAGDRTGEWNGQRTGIAGERADDRPVDTAGEVEKSAEHGLTTTTPGDAAKGAVAGAGIGVGVGVLAALATLFIPGVGLVVGGGALAAALAGTAGAAGAGAVAGGMYGYLRDLGVPDDASEQFAEDYKANHVIVAVTVAPDRLSQEYLWQLADKYHASRRFETSPTQIR